MQGKNSGFKFPTKNLDQRGFGWTRGEMILYSAIGAVIVTAMVYGGLLLLRWRRKRREARPELESSG